MLSFQQARTVWKILILHTVRTTLKQRVYFSSTLYVTHMAIDTQHFKTLLQKEKERLLKELGTLGRVNPSNAADWEATPENRDTMRADKSEAADAVEEYEGRAAVEVELENHLQNINAALQRIENNTYGVCEVGGEMIEEDRLEANPAAKTCKAHLEG